MTTRATFGLLAAALLVAGCNDATAVVRSPLRGTYALRTVDGAPLPYLQLENSLIRQYVLADTLVFDGKQTVAHITALRIDSVAHPHSDFRRDAGAYTYRLRGDTVEFVYSCPFGAYCLAPPVAWLKPGYRLGYAYRRYPSGFGPTSLYQRVN